MGYKNEIDEIKTTPDGKILLVGLPNKRRVLFYSLHHEALRLAPLPGGVIEVSINILTYFKIHNIFYPTIDGVRHTSDRR